SGAVNAVFTVTLSAASPQAVSVQFATASGTATAGSDYQSTSGTLTIPANSLTGTISVPVIGDTVIESNETFVVNLSNPVNGTISTGQGTGTIVDDDDPGTNGMYVWDIVVTSRTRGSNRHDEQISVTVRRDSVHVGFADATDALVSRAAVTVVLLNSQGQVVASFSGNTANRTGVFQTGWVQNLANGTYLAEVTGLSHATYIWNRNLD